jgi:hypothetical protein
MNAPMASIQEKKDLILKYEESFADGVAVSVIDKPKLSTWMILIPIIFIHYFYRLKKFTDGRKEFAGHFILTRKRALEEAAASLESGARPDVEAIVNMSSAPEQTHAAYREWVRVLLDHYLDLLRSKGDSFEALVRSTYNTRANYLLFINHLNRVENQFNAALKPFLVESTQGVDSIVKDIEQRCGELRRGDAERIFQ